MQDRLWAVGPSFVAKMANDQWSPAVATIPISRTLLIASWPFDTLTLVYVAIVDSLQLNSLSDPG